VDGRSQDFPESSIPAHSGATASDFAMMPASRRHLHELRGLRHARQAQRFD
jgi:hypothetical protein